MAAGGSSEELVFTYQTTRRHISDHSQFHSDRGQFSTLQWTATSRATQDTTVGVHKYTMEMWVGLEECGML